jgi:hypothetical protein
MNKPQIDPYTIRVKKIRALLHRLAEEGRYGDHVVAVTPVEFDQDMPNHILVRDMAGTNNSGLKDVVKRWWPNDNKRFRVWKKDSWKVKHTKEPKRASLYGSAKWPVEFGYVGVTEYGEALIQAIEEIQEVAWKTEGIGLHTRMEHRVCPNRRHLAHPFDWVGLDVLSTLHLIALDNFVGAERLRAIAKQASSLAYRAKEEEAKRLREKGVKVGSAEYVDAIVSAYGGTYEATFAARLSLLIDGEYKHSKTPTEGWKSAYYRTYYKGEGWVEYLIFVLESGEHRKQIRHWIRFLDRAMHRMGKDITVHDLVSSIKFGDLEELYRSKDERSPLEQWEDEEDKDVDQPDPSQKPSASQESGEAQDEESSPGDPERAEGDNPPESEEDAEQGASSSEDREEEESSESPEAQQADAGESSDGQEQSQSGQSEDGQQGEGQGEGQAQSESSSDQSQSQQQGGNAESSGTSEAGQTEGSEKSDQSDSSDSTENTGSGNAGEDKEEETEGKGKESESEGEGNSKDGDSDAGAAPGEGEEEDSENGAKGDSDSPSEAKDGQTHESDDGTDEWEEISRHKEALRDDSGGKGGASREVTDVERNWSDLEEEYRGGQDFAHVADAQEMADFLGMDYGKFKSLRDRLGILPIFKRLDKEVGATGSTRLTPLTDEKRLVRELYTRRYRIHTAKKVEVDRPTNIVVVILDASGSCEEVYRSIGRALMPVIHALPNTVLVTVGARGYEDIPDAVYGEKSLALVKAIKASLKAGQGYWSPISTKQLVNVRAVVAFGDSHGWRSYFRLAHLDVPTFWLDHYSSPRAKFVSIRELIRDNNWSGMYRREWEVRIRNWPKTLRYAVGVDHRPDRIRDGVREVLKASRGLL